MSVLISDTAGAASRRAGPDGGARLSLRRFRGRLARPAAFVSRLVSTWSGATGLVLIAMVMLCALAPELFSRQNPLTIDPLARLQGPSLAHLMGTDQLGRDLYARMIHGARPAMGIAVGSSLLSATIGLLLGLFAGYGPRLLDSALLLICDAIVSLPMIIFALAVVALIGPSILGLVLIIVIFSIPAYFRFVRSQALVLRGAEYVKAARAIGASIWTIVFRHLLPNVLGPLLIMAAMNVPSIIALESGLSFLGQGVQPPTPDWGGMLNDGYSYIRQGAHVIVAGSLPIILSTIGFILLGEALRDALDPRSAGRSKRKASGR